MVRYLFLLSLLLLTAPRARACSCILPPYPTLCSLIDEARTNGSNVVVVRVTDLADESVGLSIETELLGTAPFSAFRFARGNGANCGIPLSEATVGSRYLGLFDLTEDRREYSGLKCGYRYNMFPIVDGAIGYNNDVKAIQNDGAPPLLYFDLETLVSTGACTPYGELFSLDGGLRLWPNPTFRMIQLDTLRTIPILDRIELFDVAGRAIGSWSGPIVFPYQLDLGDLPSGVYLLRITADRQRRIFRIVRA
jgi:hypothetical protein